jgi:hypothetical protein
MCQFAKILIGEHHTIYFGAIFNPLRGHGPFIELRPSILTPTEKHFNAKVFKTSSKSLASDMQSIYQSMVMQNSLSLSLFFLKNLSRFLLSYSLEASVAFENFLTSTAAALLKKLGRDFGRSCQRPPNYEFSTWSIFFYSMLDFSAITKVGICR